MQIHSLKLTIQDVRTKDSAKIAVVMGTLFIDEGKKQSNPETMQPEPVYEQINFTTALNNSSKFKQCIQEMIIEALTLKNLKIARENGNLTHFVESVGYQTKKPGIVRRISKVRGKKK